MRHKLLVFLLSVGTIASLGVLSGCNFLLVGGGGGGNDNGDDNGGDGAGSDFALFTDPVTGFSTTIVRDVDEETVQFKISTQAIVYQDGTEYQPGSWTADGNFLGGGAFQIRFGSVGGEKRAYFTETAPGTVCNFVVTGGQFQILPTNQLPPQN